MNFKKVNIFDKILDIIRFKEGKFYVRGGFITFSFFPFEIGI